ncbi:MAG: extracellular solute-binding protein [Actinobacteria bacterium]|nr:extracellular solute-binding protein [Actinomycetota bacterium]
MLITVFLLFLGISCKTQEAVETTVEGAVSAEETATEETEVSETTAAETTTEMSEMEKAIEDGKKYAGSTIKVAISTDAALSKFKDITQDFEEATGITVELNEMGWDVLLNQTMMSFASGAPEMDVYDIWEDLVNENAPKGAFVDLSEYMATEIEQIIPGVLFNVEYKDIICGFPILPSWQIVFYNKDLWSEGGLTEADIPKTFSQLEEIIKKLSIDTDGDGAIDRYAYIADWTVEWGINAYGLYHKALGENLFEIMDGQVHCLYDTASSIEAVNFMKRLYDGKFIDPGVLAEAQWDVTTKYSNEQIVMMSMFEMYTSYLEQEMRDKTGYFAFPGKEEGMSASIVGHEFLGIPTYSKNQDAAKAYIKYVCSHEVMKFRTLSDYVAPLYKVDYDDSEIKETIPFIDALNLAANNAVISMRPPVLGGQEINEMLLTKVHEAILGEKTVEEALSEAQAEADTFETQPEIEKFIKYFSK